MMDTYERLLLDLGSHTKEIQAHEILLEQKVHDNYMFAIFWLFI